MDPRAPEGSVEAWAMDYLASEDFAAKKQPPPAGLFWEDAPPVRKVEAPGRDPKLELIQKTKRSIRASELGNAATRAKLMHTFLHHELQAAELMCWAIGAFPESPAAFRHGLLEICRDEIRHMCMYVEYLAAAGLSYGVFPVRDWFWERVPQVDSALGFVSLLGMGLEGGNLDHAKRFAAAFEAVGDHAGAGIHARILEEEIAHVRFALHWFREWTGGIDFETWRKQLVKPLSPSMFKGKVLNREARLLAGMNEAFLKELEDW